MSLLNFWDTQRPVKRRRTSDKENTITDAEVEQPSPSPSVTGRETFPADDLDQIPNSQTDLETSLLAIKTDEDAIEEYESSKDSKLGLHVRLRDGVWQKGQSSIYVDAFNLALETVLDEESHLFSVPEMEIFTQWRKLSYESQYLYVLVDCDWPGDNINISLVMSDCSSARLLPGIVSTS
jgi:Fanconi-associated nuclease 1